MSSNALRTRSDRSAFIGSRMVARAPRGVEIYEITVNDRLDLGHFRAAGFQAEWHHTEWDRRGAHRTYRLIWGAR